MSGDRGVGTKRVVLSVVAGVLVSSCQGAGVTYVDTPTPPPAAYRVILQPDPEDNQSAQALGWSAIPDAEVTLTPIDSSRPSLVLRTSADGSADFGTIPSGTYTLWVRRWLNPSELSRPGLGDVDGWVAKALVSHGGARPDTIEVPASRKRSIVISEWAFNGAWSPEAGDFYYWFGGYLELYNNADTTTYLDGMIVGEGWWASLDAPPNFPCAHNEPYRNDPDGIWSRDFQRFPGSGHDFPILPGGIAVVAIDAIDHRPLFPPLGLDLRNSQFEMVGTPDADNPSIPNLLDLSLSPSPAGHGLIFYEPVTVPFLALPTDVSSLTRARPSGGKEWARFPAEKVLDAFAIGSRWLGQGLLPECLPLVNRRFDRKESRARSTETTDLVEYDFSISRRILPVIAGARQVLQHTRSGDADFVRTKRNPGILPVSPFP